MAIRPVQTTVQLLSFLLFVSLRTATLSYACIEHEREALLDLKSNLDDPSHRLRSWAGLDCCSWAGVGCDTNTGHVVRLDLRQPDSPGSMQLTGKLDPSLVALQHLNYLDLSWNDFQGAPLPEFLDSFPDLTYLNLSYAEFSYSMPPRFGNISGLRWLDLSGNYMSNLDTPENELQLLQALGVLDSLHTLRLAECRLSSIPQSLPSGSFKSLASLDLSNNNFNSTVPLWLLNITSLEYLDLAGNSFQGTIPPSIGMLSSLTFLDLSFNIAITAPIPKQLGTLCNLRSLDLSYLNLSSKLSELDEVFSGCIKSSLEALDLSSSQVTGSLPDWLGGTKNLKHLRLFGNTIYGSLTDSIGHLSSLETLDVRNNHLNGTVATSLGELSSLVSLDLGHNSMNGVLSEAHLANLTRLKSLDLSENSLVIEVASDWCPGFQIGYLAVSSCRLGPRFPRWLRNQTNLNHLEFSGAGISDAMPDWFWNLTSRLDYLDISNNQISGRLPKLLILGNGDHLQIRLNSNRFEGLVPQFPSNVGRLDLSNNSFSGPLHSSNISTMQSLDDLSLSMNNLTGSTPPSVCKLVRLKYLDLSNNHLSGELPDCWNQSSQLQGMDFSSNHLSGAIPSSICLLRSLQTMHLGNNRLTGEIPSFLMNCTYLATLDLGYNLFAGTIPSWIGEGLRNLKILSLRANMLDGDLPPQLSQLASLGILDLSHNNLSGNIPTSFGNFSAMMSVQTSLAPILMSFIRYNDYMVLFIKGKELDYKGLLSLLRIIDLSDNNLSGNVPVELTNLVGLQSLNLSKNHLRGRIVDGIGRLRQLESLDLSRNELSGAVPPGLGTLPWLSILNLSYNSLAGRIPSGNQLQTLADPSIYVGNLDLCGFPLPRSCESGDHGRRPPTSSPSRDDEGESGEEVKWTLAGTAPGLVVGISIFYWGVLFQKERRGAYFKWLDKMLNC